MNLKKGILSLGATLALAGGFLVNETIEANAAGWEARTIEEIKNDIEVNDLESTYTIQWGDTLGAITSAFEIPMNKVAQLNNIANVNLIMTGNVLHFSADQKTVSLEDTATKEVKSYDVSEEEVKEVKPVEVKETAEEAPAQESQQEQTVKPASSSQNIGQFQATAYTAYDGSQIGITRGGTNMANGNIWTASGHRIVAADPSVIPFGSIVRITLASGEVINGKVDDTGGAINGNIIDISFASVSEAMAFGRQNVQVEIIQ